MVSLNKESLKALQAYFGRKKYPIIIALVALALVGSVILFAVSHDDTLPKTAAAQPAVTEPPAAEPAVTDPAATEPAAEEPPATEPAPEEPTPAEPAAEPAATEPAPAEQAAEVPTAADPAAEEPTPAVTEPAPEEPTPTEPAAEPAVTEPAPEEPTPAEPAATEPVPTEPAIDEPVAETEPTAEEPPAEPEPAPIGSVAVAIVLSKVDFLPEEPIELTLLGIEGQESKVTVTVADQGSPDDSFVSSFVPAATQNAQKAPPSSGTYEIRVYSGTGTPTAENLLAKASIIVTGRASGEFKVEIDEADFKAGSRVKVRVSGVPTNLIASGAFVGVFPKGAKTDAFTFAIAISEPEEELFLDLPRAAGQYEIRAHSGNDPITDAGLVAVFPIETK
ncbi:MAG: hypothetical protein LBJ61_05940 [Deltaproteobacteria bacterium]|jgi:hypothetical protein|nr:hypothetical protein [Deltaproteobacteria bacterium]